MRTITSFATALFCLSHAAYAAVPTAIHFEHKDWELACDNTRTCRAAGYSDEKLADHGVSVLLTRRAGPGEPVRAQLQLAHDSDDAVPHTLQMQIGGRALGIVQLDPKDLIGELSPTQTAALLDAIVRDEQAVWKAGAETWVLSTKGANAVLLKMDDFQGRLGTTGALVRKGTKPESGVLPPLPPPRITHVAVPAATLTRSPLTPQQESALITELRRTVKSDDCELLGERDTKLEYAPLSNDLLLVSALCWRAAYNDGSAYWVINKAPPFAPHFVTNTAGSYERGVIQAVQKGRGIADCLSTDTWTWDGNAFIHTASGTTGMCRAIAGGGAWELPTLVTDVHPAK